jgi:hypothetical protein
MNVKIKIYKDLTYLEIGLKNGVAHVSGCRMDVRDCIIWRGRGLFVTTFPVNFSEAHPAFSSVGTGGSALWA